MGDIALKGAAYVDLCIRTTAEVDYSIDMRVVEEESKSKEDSAGKPQQDAIDLALAVDNEGPWTHSSDKELVAMRDQIRSDRTAMENDQIWYKNELHRRFGSLPHHAQDDVLEWLNDKLAGCVSDCEEVEDEWRTREWLNDNEVSTAQQVSANEQMKNSLEAHLDEVEAKIETTERYTEGCPEGVSLSGTTEGCPADGEGFESCSDEDTPDHS